MKKRLGVIAGLFGLSVSFGQELNEEVVQRLKDFAVTVGRQVEIVVHVQMGNAAVRLDEIWCRIDQLDSSHQRHLVGQQFVDLGIALTERIHQMATRQQRLEKPNK